MDDRPLPRWIWASILVGAGFFIVALLVSAIFDPTIRVLHILQALIYIAVIVLARRNSAWGFGAGFTISLVWNYVNLFVTTFIAAGLHQLSVLLHTGRIERPDLLIAVVAGGGHFLLLAGCLAGFLRLRPGGRQWGRFVAGGVVAVLYFAAIIVTTGPQYVHLFKRVFHIAGLVGAGVPENLETRT
jgi:hypothetical protein